MIIVVKGPINDKPAVVQIIHDNSFPEPIMAYFTGGLSEITNEPFYDMISVYLNVLQQKPRGEADIRDVFL